MFSRKTPKAKQPVIPKDLESILSSVGIDEKIAKRLLVDSDKGKIIPFRYRIHGEKYIHLLKFDIGETNLQRFLESFQQLQGKVESIVGDTNPDIAEVLKDIRRKNKNKDSAASSRHKKLNRIQQLKVDKHKKEKELDYRNRLISGNQVCV